MSRAMKKKIVFLPYDFDTAIGINNEGSLVFSYNLEDTDHTEGGADVFNGQQSVLWNNLRDTFGPELRSMYQTLRSRGVLSYAVVEKMFEDHQAKWPEAIFNEDAWYKYLAPLEEDNNASYLAMLQGSKASQRKWWLNNRFRYMDSKYNAGDALTDVITVRAYAKGNISVTPYADVYAAVKYGSYLVQSRATRGAETTLVCPLDTMNDTECYVYSASQLASVGDLSDLMVGYADFSMALKLQNLVLGKSNAGLNERDPRWYSNGNLKTLYLGNNTLLQSIDVRNCTGLGTGEQTTVDVSGCSNIRTVLFDGTNITGLTLPDGGVIETLHLPSTITILKVLNQTEISDFVCPDTTHISTLWLDNASGVIDACTILSGMEVGSRVRLFNFAWDMDEAHDVSGFMAVLDTMRGLDQNGNNTPTAQIYGTIHVPAASTWFLGNVHDRYSDLSITYDTLYLTVLYKDYNASLLDYELVDSGKDAEGGLNPTREPTNTTVFTFDGWATETGGAVDTDALKEITADRSVYAHYAESTRYYTVRFFNGETLLDTQYIAYGGYAVYYDGDTGTNAPAYDGPGDPEDYQFTGWDQDVSYITHDVDTYAVFVYAPVYVRKYLENRLTDYADQNDLIDIGAYAFAGNTELVHLDMPSLTFSGGKVPELAFSFVSNLESYTFGTDFSAVTEIAPFAFWNFISNDRIRDINNAVIPQTMTFPNVETIGKSAFYAAGYLHLHFPKLTTVGDRAFAFSSVVTLDLPALKSVGTTSQEVFAYMDGLQSLILSGLTGDVTPTSVLSRQSYTTLRLVDCGFTTRFNQGMSDFTSLETVILRNTSVVTFQSVVVYLMGLFAANSPIGQGTGKIYVPENLVDAYKTATGWSTYADCFTAIEGSPYELN